MDSHDDDFSSMEKITPSSELKTNNDAAVAIAMNDIKEFTSKTKSDRYCLNDI